MKANQFPKRNDAVSILAFQLKVFLDNVLGIYKLYLKENRLSCD